MPNVKSNKTSNSRKDNSYDKTLDKLKASVNYYDKIKFNASKWITQFALGPPQSLFLPYNHMICDNKIDNETINRIASILQKQANEAHNTEIWKKDKFNYFYNFFTVKDTNADPDTIDLEPYENIEIDGTTPYLNTNDCKNKLKDRAKKLIDQYERQKDGSIRRFTEYNSKQSKLIEKYTIDLRKIREEDKNFFENFISIPPALEESVNYYDNDGMRQDLPICYLVSNDSHSYLVIQTPEGIIFFIGFAPLTKSTGYNDMKKGTENDMKKGTENDMNQGIANKLYPGRAEGLDMYFTPASSDENNWISYVGFLDKKILKNLKKMLESTTLIKFTTVNGFLVDSVSVSFFESTAKQPIKENNYSYSDNHNCLGWVQRILGITIQDNENIPSNLKPLSPKVLEFIEQAHRTGCSNRLYDVIKYIQTTYTLGGVQKFFSEYEPHKLKKHFTLQNIRELFSNPRQNLIPGDIIKQLSKIFITDDNNNILFNPKVQHYEFTKEELNQIFTSNNLDEIFSFNPEVLRQIFTRENKCMPEQVKEIFGDKYAAIFPSVGDKPKMGGNKSKSKRSKSKSRRNKAKKKTLRKRKN